MAPGQPQRQFQQQSSILSNLGLSRSERVLGILLFALVIGGLTLGKLNASEAVTILVALTGIGAALSTGRKTTAEASDAYASAAQKAIEARAELEDRIQEFVLDIESLKKRLTARENRVKTLEQQNERLRLRLDEKDELLRSHQDQLTKLTEAVLQKDARIEELEALTTRQNSEIAELRSQVDQLKAAGKRIATL
jgi:DNA repair exonuclease SbcCD ATPase subunit